MAVPQYARTMGTMVGELEKWYGFAETCRGNWSLRRNGSAFISLNSDFLYIFHFQFVIFDGTDIGFSFLDSLFKDFFGQNIFDFRLDCSL